MESNCIVEEGNKQCLLLSTVNETARYVRRPILRQEPSVPSSDVHLVHLALWASFSHVRGRNDWIYLHLFLLLDCLIIT